MFHRGDDVPFYGALDGRPVPRPLSNEGRSRGASQARSAASLKDTMLIKQLCNESNFKQVEQEVTDVIADAVKFADESPFPDPSTLHTDVMAEE